MGRLSLPITEIDPADDATVRAYELGAQAYLDDAASRAPHPTHVAFRQAALDRLSPGARLLELGTGPGRDAQYFEDHGLSVRRTDATRAFVERLRRAGHAADLLDVTSDDLGGPYEGIYANAVLLHLTSEQLAALLVRARSAVVPGGLLAFTVKEGDGEQWSTAKLGHPRFFRYWRAEPLTDLVTQTGWDVDELRQVTGNAETWLQLLCRPATSP